MQHIMNEEEFTEYTKSKEVLKVAQWNQTEVEKFLSGKCLKKTHGYCDDCPIQTTVKLGSDSHCMAGMYKDFSQ